MKVLNVGENPRVTLEPDKVQKLIEDRIVGRKIKSVHLGNAVTGIELENGTVLQFSAYVDKMWFVCVQTQVSYDVKERVEEIIKEEIIK